MIFKENFFVGYSDTNSELKLSNVALLRFFENVASLHGSSVGDGIKDSPCVWFLTGYHVKIHRRPAMEERLTASTWSRTMKGFSSSREFSLHDAEGKLVVSAISNWARIDRATGRPVRLDDALYELYGSEPDVHHFDEPWLGRLKECTESLYERTFFIDRNFIDANLHMNNVHYLELSNLVLPEELYVKEPNEFSIRYRKAIVYGETVKCAYGKQDGHSVVTVRSAEGDDVRAIIHFY